MLRRRPARLAALAAVALLAPMLATAGASTVSAASGGDDTPTLLTPKGEIADEFNEVDDAGSFAKRNDAYDENRLLSGDDPLSTSQAAALRGKGIAKAATLPVVNSKTQPSTVGGAWTSLGPGPTVQVARTSNTFEAVSGRIGALAIRKNGDLILGAAGGGVWTYDRSSGTWISRSANTDSQAVGALATAPSNDKFVYMGSGEGALSGDSYYGDGIYQSKDGGKTWIHASGTFFEGVAVSHIVVDPTDPNHLYVATLRGRGGVRRTTAPSSQQYGIWQSVNGGKKWTASKVTSDEFRGATDLVMDPTNPLVLWASFWGDKIYRSTDGGLTWASAMGDLPPGNFSASATRFSLGLSHPAGAAHATVLTGFDYNDTGNVHHSARVWKTTDDGAHWTVLPTGGSSTSQNSIADYCTTQCFYDNVVAPDPKNPDTIYVEGSYGYNKSPASGGIYRSTDGGATWKNIGYDLHPDYHAFAFDPSNSQHVALGNDGGVWESMTGGGRNNAGDPLSASDWKDLNGTVDPNTGALLHATGLTITQFTSIATVPLVSGQYWGGTQDNGTQRKSLANERWFDQPSGDGGQVIVDQTTPNLVNPNVSAYVFGTYFAVSPYRFNPSGVGAFFGNEPIDGGINVNERAEFYIPWVENRNNTNQMFLGTYRLYRTNNAETPQAGDVHWDPISGDLTSGCTGTPSNGARACVISAVGVADGGDAVYTGSDDGKVFVNPHAVTEPVPSPTNANAGWQDITQSNLPNRPVSQIAVDRSNWRTAYLSYAGFSAATPTAPGHVFKTTDGGQHWADISNGLPDLPTNSVVLDPAFPNTLYAGTDAGVFVTTNGGGAWSRLGSGDPTVSSWQLDFDASHRLLINGTHGRGAYSLTDSQQAPALIVSKADSGKPVGPGSTIDYTVTVKNIGNADATGVTVSDPVPAHTTVVGAGVGDGGTVTNGTITWSGKTVPKGGSIDLHFSATIDPSLPASVTQIVDDGLTVTAAGGFGTTGSPHTTAIAPQFADSVDPADQAGGGKVGGFATYKVDVNNDGYGTDHYTLSTSGTWTTTTYAADCTTPETTTADVLAGDSTTVCVKVAVPADAAGGSSQESTMTATSAGDPTVSATASMTTNAVTADTLLVDEDGNGPDVSAIYKTALTSTGVSFDYWDLAEDPVLPESYLDAHSKVVWFTGNSYPAPLGGYENELTGFLEGGGGLLMTGQDILDQAAGTTPFVHDYLHIDWDGSEVQNDKATVDIHGVVANPVGGGFSAVPLDHSVLNANFEDQITPIDPATAAFTDDSGATDGLSVTDTGTSGTVYHVVFLAFPLEAYGSTADKTDLMGRALTFFGP
jgi:uncharacterized repeat protein (TIGR01451 family)